MHSQKLDDFFHELGRRVQGAVRRDPISRLLYSTDASIYQVEPHGVFLPRSVEEVQAAVELAAQYQVPLLPRGAGTSLAGQAVNQAVVIDATRWLDRILEVNPEEKWARAQAGVVLASLNARLKPLGLKYGPDPASGNRAVLGGIVANNSSGSHSILYGMSADHVLAAQVVLADGSLAQFGPLSPAELAQAEQRPGLEGAIYRQVRSLAGDAHNQQVIRTRTPAHWRRCGGYNLDRLTDGQGLSYRWPFDPRFNLARLICGSEGTLGLITEVTLNLVDLPGLTGLAVVHFADLRPALEAVPTLLEVEPSAIELLDRYDLELVKNAPLYAHMLDSFIQGDPDCILITEFYGESPAEIEGKLQRLAAHLRQRRVPCSAITNLTDPQGIQAAWKVREAGFGILMSMRGDVKPLAIADDAAVPPSHLADYIFRLEAYCKEVLDHEMTYFAHASAGCLHVHSLLNPKLAGDVAKYPRLMQAAGELLQEYGGVLSSEHGDGRLRSWLNPTFYGEELYGLFKQVKRIFDPQNLFNPGDIVDAPAMTEHLRYGPGYQAQPRQPFLDFQAEQGLDRAIEMCNGAAVCRQLAGTMCPSFKATREEQHSTRGRANALRLALSGRIEWDAPQVYETLDLCVACRACKSECPSTVDMARLKSEYLHRYYRQHAMPLRARFFARFGELSELAGGPLAPLANAVLRFAPLRGVMNRALHLAPQRRLPVFARQSFDAWVRRRSPRGGGAGRPLAALLVDVAANNVHPQVAQQALAVLEACGFEVIVPPVHDFGRAAFSKGSLELARRKARRAVRLLAPTARLGVPLVALEPSDLSMLVEDNLALLPGDADAQQAAAGALSFEEFLWRQARAGGLEGRFEPQHGQVLLHGHCHQKALGGVQHSQELLAYLGYAVEEAASGCCGMAGAFGYEAEHYALSMQMGELTLFPAVRAQAEAALVVALGVSCREQIAQGTGRSALHPAQVLFQALAAGTTGMDNP